MESKIINAPFTDEEVRVLKLWQANDYLHPYTCCDGESMLVANEGLKCPVCGMQRFWVQDFSTNEKSATYNPFNNTKLKNLKTNT